MKLVKTFKRKKDKPKDFNSLIFEIQTKNTVVEREQVVIDNLRKKGLI